MNDLNNHFVYELINNTLKHILILKIQLKKNKTHQCVILPATSKLENLNGN